MTKLKNPVNIKDNNKSEELENDKTRGNTYEVVNADIDTWNSNSQNILTI